MHSRDRTLLSSLGFSDPDKKEPLHDFACQYLSQEHVSSKLLAKIVQPSFDTRPTPVTRADFRGVERSICLLPFPAVFERPLVKGEGQYRSCIGFLDLVIPFEYRTDWDGEAPCSRFTRDANAGWILDRGSHISKASLIIEVKIKTIAIGDLIRQLNLYREFFPDRVQSTFWIAATTFAFSGPALSALHQTKIHHVRLGPAFEEWAREHSTPRDDPGSSLVL